MGEKKTGWVDIVQTFWPVMLFILGVAVWAVKSQSVSHASFNNLKSRVLIVEQKIPDKESMKTIHANQAVMRSLLDRLTKDMDDVLKKLGKR